MQFNSVDFMLFFPVVLAVYFVIPRKARSFWLLVASYYFYMCWSAKYAVLIGGSTIITYISAILMEKSNKLKKANVVKKTIMILCIVINLGILALFKYGNFAVDSVNFVLRYLNISTINHRFNFLLPVGISFYTFQALGYIIDVYRGDVKVEKNLPRYALFVSFFPQLVAGPIERSKNLLTQMQNIESINLWQAKRVASGAIMMVWGFFMKMVIADRVALLVDTVFNNYHMYGGTELLIAAIGFTLQIYCDFGSYSTIAIGSAKVMGFELMENFNTPYLAHNIRDFWSRWHISLSTWFKDYLYIPLGGNRKGKLRKCLNIMIVFLVSGLWHGANWSFVVWGGIHGFYQAFADIIYKPRMALRNKLKINTECFSFKLYETVVTFALVVFAWIFFRADSIRDALRIIQRIVFKQNIWILFHDGIYALGLNTLEMNILVIAVLVLAFVDCIKYFTKDTLDDFLNKQNLLFKWMFIIGLVVAIFVFGEYGPTFDAQQFIYFQF